MNRIRIEAMAEMLPDDVLRMAFVLLHRCIVDSSPDFRKASKSNPSCEGLYCMIIFFFLFVCGLFLSFVAIIHVIMCSVRKKTLKTKEIS